MEEEIGVRVTRSRRRLSVEKSDDANSPLGTPTVKRNQKLALKPHLDNIGENEVVPSPKRTTRRSIVSEPDEAVLTPSKRSTRVRSNTSLSSVAESPRSLRITRRNSLLAENEPPDKVTPPKPKGVRRISQDFNSISRNENGNTPKLSTSGRSEHNISLPRNPALIQNDIKDSVANINDFTSTKLEVKLDRIKEQTFKLSSQKASDIKGVDRGVTNIDRFAVALLEINMDDEKSVSNVSSTTPPIQLRKSQRLRSKSNSNSPEELSYKTTGKAQEEVSITTDQQNNSIDSFDLINSTKDVSDKILLSQNNSKTKPTLIKDKYCVQNSCALIEDDSNKIASTNIGPVTAKESKNISPSNEENKSLISADKDTVSGKSMCDESENVSFNSSSNALVLASGSSRKSGYSFEKSQLTCISSESLKLNTSQEQKIKKQINNSHESGFHATEDNVGHQNSINKIICETSLDRNNDVIKNIDAEELMDVDEDEVGDVKVSLDDNEIKSTSAVNKSYDNNINDIGQLSKQQSTQIFSTIIMDDEKPNNVALFPMGVSVEELFSQQEISKSHIEKSVDAKPNKEMTVDDANIPNIVAGNKAEEGKATVVSKEVVNKSHSTNTTDKNDEKTRDDVACSEVRTKIPDVVEKLQEEVNEGLSGRNSGKKQSLSKSFSNDLKCNGSASDIKNKLGNSLYDSSQLTPKRTTKSLNLGMVSSTPIVDNTGEIETHKKVISASKNNKNFESQSSDDDSIDGAENDFLDNEAMDGGDDYESGDSLCIDEREEMEQNEIREKGETLNSDDESIGDSDYEKDSFLASSDEEDEALLSGTGDDLDLSGNELSQSAKSKEKYDKRMSREQKQASREMYEARHGVTNNTKSLRKSSSRKTETDSSESDDSEIILKKSANQSKMRLDSSCDISKSKAEKEISYSQLNNEFFINDSNVTDPSSCVLPFKKRTLSTSSNKSKGNVENSPVVILRPDDSVEGEIAQVEVDENTSVYLNKDKTIDPLSHTACDDGDLSSLSSVDASVVGNYNSVLSVLNQSNICVLESSDEESDNEKSPKSASTGDSGANDDKTKDKSTLDMSIVNSSTIGNDLKNVSGSSLRISDSKLKMNKNNSIHKSGQDLSESTVEVPVERGKASEKRKSKGMSILDNDYSSAEVNMHGLNDASMTSSVKKDLCSEDRKFITKEGDKSEIKNKIKRKISNSDIELLNIVNTTNNYEEASETKGKDSVNQSGMKNYAVKVLNTLEDSKEKLSKKMKNELKNRSLNFNDVSSHSLLGNESIIENLNLTIKKKRNKKNRSIVSLTDGTNLDMANLCELTKEIQINSDCVIENKKKNKDNDKLTDLLGAAETESIAEEDTKKSVKKKKKKKKQNNLSSQSLNFIENGNEKSLPANASVIDNLNLTIEKRHKKKVFTESRYDRKSQVAEMLDKLVTIIGAIENMGSKPEVDKELSPTNNTAQCNSDIKLKKAKKKKTRNKSLNDADSADVSQASVFDTNIKETNEYKDNSFYGQTNKGKDCSVLVTDQVVEMGDRDSEDFNVRLLFSSDEETASVSAKVEDILSCTAMRDDELKKPVAKPYLIANGDETIGNGAQISRSTSCENINKKRKRKRNKKKKADQAKAEETNVTKIEKGTFTEEPLMKTISNDPEEKSSKKHKNRRQRNHVIDSETAEHNEEVKLQTQKRSLKTGLRKEQVVHEPEPRAKKRKLIEEPVAVHKKSKLLGTDDQPREIRRLPQTFLDHLSQASKASSSALQVTKLVATSKFKVDRANKRKAQPSEHLEQSILVGGEPTWTSNSGAMRTVKKPKLLPSIPTVSTSGEGFTTQFKVIPLVSEMRRKNTMKGSEHAIRNFRTDALYGKKIKRITSEQLVRKQSNPQLW